MTESDDQRPRHQLGIPPGLGDGPPQEGRPPSQNKPGQERDLAAPLGWIVDAVARIRASVHVKLLAGFLLGAFLLLAMGILSLGIISRMNGRATELNVLAQQVDLARQMEYDITAQSHYRAMALYLQPT